MSVFIGVVIGGVIYSIFPQLLAIILMWKTHKYIDHKEDKDNGKEEDKYIQYKGKDIKEDNE